ncbi:penicillin-binding transpeptidase domain-containing protein [Prosthecobacter sp.]|uniref:penicillin-binding transpeptidase domain-containing protein n=1 Tax=Prosthecobacter sp. TaxID=1965333 RepID=UPI00248810A9|nr:penicillin-binding transpeptidase domain-containing protein [Prosthecobacter sp.]MDI1312955.1 penicillin-binding transpeptidase domain-containing protein [Prosthecobacter sp.]
MNTTPLLELLSHTAMKGAAVLLVALLLGLILHTTAASRRYAIWITAIAALAVLPLAMWALPAWRVLPKATSEMDWPIMEEPLVSDRAANLLPLANRGVTSAVAKSEVLLPAQAVAEPAFSWNVSWQDVVVALPVVWLFIAALLLLRLGWSAWCLCRLERHLQAGSCEQVAEIAREIGLRRLPQLWLGAADAVPMVWGVLKPRLLLPQGFETWSREKQRGVLLHELAHLKRGDPLALWAAQWVKALHWFNPLVWLTFRQLRADQERACDDAVLRHGVRASDYAQALLDLSRHNRLAPGLALCALTITRCAPVEARVKAILDPTRRREGLTLRWLAGLAGGALLITLPVAMLHAIEGHALRGRILDRNGVVLAESTKEKVRVYPLKTLAAHVVGYTRLPDSDDARLHGGAGVEKKEDLALKAGNDFTLSLDARIQAVTQQAMKDGGVERGAVVVLDPRTGEILASVSLPSYDPNLCIPSISYKNWDRYLTDVDQPLLNRVVKGNVPGDAFTPLTALAAISKGLGDKTFNCRRATTSYQSKFECLQIRQGGKGHGTIGVEQALQTSCRHYWCQLGMLAGFDALGKMGKDIGFGQRYGALEDEDSGVLPTQEWWEKRRQGKRAWSEDNTASLAEGYGYASVTPLQMAVLAATVANSGRVPQPTLTMTAKTGWRADLIKEGLSASQIEKLREGMRLAVNSESGSGRSARSGKVMIAGKTGATKGVSRTDKGELIERNNSWFIGFAPFDQPTFAFAILNQGGKTVGDCAPIAKRIVEEILALPADGSGEVKPVEEKSATAPTKFDFDAAETSRQIKALSAEAGIIIKEFKMGQGNVSILGEAAGMLPARNYQFKLMQLGKERNIQWTVPTTREMDNKGVRIEASGVYEAEAPNDVPATAAPKPASEAAMRQQSDAAVRMRPVLANQWAQLKKIGLLADLPAEARPFDTGESEESRVKSGLQFRFDVSRGAGHRWLLATVYRSKNVDEASLQWPEPPEAFHRTYAAAGHCSISILSSDGEHLIIIVSQQKWSMLIAPDEFQEPRPAGKLAPEYKQEGFTLVAPKAPTLNPALQDVLSTISQEEALRPRAFWPPPNQIIHLQTPLIPSYVPREVLHAPLHRLAGEFSAESEEALLRNSQSSRRWQQALVVRLPQ